MHTISRILYPLVAAMVLVFMTGPVSSPFFSDTLAQPATPDGANARGATTTDTLVNSDEPVTALFELEGDSVAARQVASRAIGKAGARVELSSAETTTFESSLKADQQEFESRVAAVAPESRVIVELRKLVNAVSIRAPGYELARIAALPGVRRFQLSRQYHALLSASVPLISAPSLWKQLGGAAVSGRGVKIAILDSGIDQTNPLFSDAGFASSTGFPRGNNTMTNNKVIVAKAFLADQTATPADQNGHGTHITGIAAGDTNTPTPLGPISGVAPGAFLGNYRVLDANGTGDEALITQGLEEAFTDGFDIANISFGAPPSSSPGVLESAVAVATAGGMTVVAAAGDQGPSGESSITSPGTALNAITVAASSNAHFIGSSVSVTGPGQVPASLEGFQATTGVVCGVQSRSFPTGTVTLFDESLLDGKKLGCRLKKLPPGSLTGRVALIERGKCSLGDKINNAAAAGATAVVIYNEDISASPDGGDNLISPDTTGAMIPSIFIRRSDGLAIKSWVDANPGATISISGPAQFPQAPDVLAPFSSVGPTLENLLKPDLSAPGENIYSGAIKTCSEKGISDLSGFSSASGTSQAAAHVAGGAALPKELHPGWTVAQIKSALVNSVADPVLTEAGSKKAADVLATGTGRLDLSLASTVGATIAPANLSYGVNSLKKLKQGVTLVQTMNITAVLPGTTTFNVKLDQMPSNGVTMTQSARSIALRRGETGQVQIMISASKDAQRGDLTGLVIIGYGASQKLAVPFWVRF
jgi:subtilisin family serine protease